MSRTPLYVIYYSEDLTATQVFLDGVHLLTTNRYSPEFEDLISSGGLGSYMVGTIDSAYNVLYYTRPNRAYEQTKYVVIRK